MSDKNKHLHSKHAEELIKLSDDLDNLNMNNEPYKSFVDNTVDYHREETERDDYYRIENAKIADKTDKLYYKLASNMYTKLENRSKTKSKQKISARYIVKSSQKSIVPFFDERSKRVSPDVYIIADLNENEEVTQYYIKSQDNENCYSVPLEYVVDENTDRKIVVYAGNRKLKENEQRNEKVHAYEFGWAYNLHTEGNKQINKIVLSFLNNIFKEEKDTITALLSQPSTMVLMILNRESTLSDKISQTTIVSLVMFGVVNLVGTCIDYVGTVLPYTGMNFAPFLIHQAQVFGAKAIYRRSHGTVKDNVTLFLLCKRSLSFYYERLGFTRNDVQDYLDSSEWQPIVNRMHVHDVLKQNPQTTDYAVMRQNDVCPRFVNYISCCSAQAENLLYPENDKDERSQWSDLSMAGKLSTAFTEAIKQLIKDRTYFEYTYQYEDRLMVVNKNEKPYFENIYKEAFALPIGKLYSNGINDVMSSITSQRAKNNLNSHLFEEALKPLQIILFPEDASSDNLDGMFCWTMVKCACCKKHVYLKKRRDEFFNEFMTQTIMSIWFVHIFGLENIPNNDWYVSNHQWNVCLARKGAMFNKLKMALHKDSLKEDSENSTIMIKSMQNLDSLWEAISEKLPLLFNAVAKMCYLSVEKALQTDRRRPVGDDYAKRSKDLLETIAPQKKRTEEEDKEFMLRQQSNTNKYKRKRENKNKTERHSAEHKWKNNYYNDLNLQVKFRMIEYVDVDSCKKLRPVSEKYLKELRKERKEFQNKSGRSRRVSADDNLDENHFLMIDMTTDMRHIVDEEWFADVNESTGKTLQLVGKDTIQKTKDNPNKPMSLSTTDIRNISRYVREIKKGSQIIKIKRVTQSNAEKEEEVKKFKNHLSTSKFSFTGYDNNKNYHKISDDWVELNFKDSNLEVYKNIMALEPGEEYTIPAGSSYGLNLKELIKKFNIQLIGPKVTCLQNDNLSCLPCSLASAFINLNMDDFAERIMRLYKKFRMKYPNINYQIQDLLDVTKHNLGRTTHERKMKFNIQKVKTQDAHKLLLSREVKVLYHCVLTNNHSVVLLNEWIFDPTMERAVPRDEKHLRFCAQSDELEITKSIIFYAYKYSWK